MKKADIMKLLFNHTLREIRNLSKNVNKIVSIQNVGKKSKKILINELINIHLVLGKWGGKELLGIKNTHFILKLL